MSRRTNNQNAWEGELNAQLNPGVLSVDLITTTGITAPMYVTLAPEDPTIEIVKIISIVGNTITFEARNLEGSSGDNTHPVGTKVRAVFTKQLQDDLFDDIEDLELADTTHAGAADPHPSYILSANHGISGDPHTQYLKESDFTKAAIDALGIDAETLDGIDSTGFSVAGHTHPTGTHDHNSLYAPLSHVGSNGGAHADATTSTDGFMTASDKQKLNGIESGATADQTITAGTSLTGGGTGNVTLNHADTSSQASVSNLSGASVFNTVALNAEGHVTSLGTRTLTAANIGAITSSHGHVEIVSALSTVSFNISTGVPTGLYLNGFLYDQWNGHSTTSNRQRITSPSNGQAVMMLNAMVGFSSAAVTGYRQLEIRKNGTPIAIVRQEAVQTDQTVLSVSLMDFAGNAGVDYYEAYAYQDSGSTLSMPSGNSRFQAVAIYWSTTS